ncbi:MAG: hypothetical protein RL582_199 [Bacteroidota bacterium]|jgi:hypothetical protein
MKKNIFLAIVVSTITVFDSFAQDLPSIQIDRPDQTECPFITPKNYIQIENGFTLENIRSNQTSLSYPSTLWKYGINEKVELRVITEMVKDKNNGKEVTGIMPITVGFKTSLWEEKGILPKTSFIGHITTASIGSKDFQKKYIAPSFRFTMQHTITEKVSFAYNLGAEWNGENAAQNYIYTVTTGISLTSKLGFYAELYGFVQDYNAPDHRCDGGFTYLINNDFIADISGGFGLTSNAPRNYLSLGVSYRFKIKK